jgi:hypothetical protein
LSGHDSPPVDSRIRASTLDEPPHWLASPVAAVAIAVAAVVLATVIQQLVYPALSWNRDEPVYLWQVELLRSGHLTGSDGGFPELLHPWLSGWSDGRFFTQYPLGWPIVILAGSLVAWPGAAIVVAALLAVTGVRALALELDLGPLVANVAALVLLASPIFAVQGGLYLNYLFTLGLGLWFTSMFLAAVRLRSWWHAVIAGAVFGWIVCTRIYDAVLWGAVPLVYVAVLERGAWRRHLATAGWFLTAVAPFVIVQALHNRALTGSFLTLPITAKDPLDTFGFGSRRLMPSFETEGYGFRRAVMSTLKHGFFLPWFLVGAYLGIAVAGAAAWLQRRRHQTWLLLAFIAVFPVAYFPFWGTYVSSLTVRLSGPIYLVPLYAPLAILVASGLVALAHRRPKAAVALVVVLALVTAPVTLGRLGLNRELSRSQEAWRDSVADLDEPAVVVVAATAYLMFLNPFSANAPDAAGHVLYATNAWPSVLDLLDEHPDRLHLLQRSTRSPEELLPSEDPTRTDVVLTPLEVVRGEGVELEVTVVPPSTGEEVWLLVDERDQLRWRLVTHDSTAGEPLTATVLLVTEDASTAMRDRPLAVLLPRGQLSLTVGVAFGSATRQARLTPSVMHRVHVRTTDGVEVLVPGVSFRGRDPDARFPDLWDEVLETSALQVEVRPLAGP